MGEVLTAQADLIEGMEFVAQSSSGQTVRLDPATYAGGHGMGFLMQMALVDLAGSTAMDVISILRKKRQDVTGYEVRVRGERAENHPMAFTYITVEHVITGHGVSREAVAHAIELSEIKYSGAGAILGRIVTLRHTFRVQEAEAASDETQPNL